MIFLILLVLLMVLAELVSMRAGKKKIEYHLQTDRILAECNEPLELSARLENPGRLPVLYLKLSERVPKGMTVLDGSGKMSDPDSFTGLSSLEDSFYLMGRQALTKKRSVSFPQRGRYRFQSAVIRTGDFLGLKTRDTVCSFYRHVIVIPEKIAISGLEPALKNYMGDVSVRRFFLEDPILTAGFRDYSGREPMRDISWKMTARRQKLTVREYDHTSELSADIVLNLACGTEEEKETALSAARTMIDLLEDRKLRSSFRTNAVITDSVGTAHFIPEGLGYEHRTRILSALGSALPLCMSDLSVLLKETEASGKKADGTILITPPLPPEMRSRVLSYEKRTGGHCFLIEGGKVHDRH